MLSIAAGGSGVTHVALPTGAWRRALLALAAVALAAIGAQARAEAQPQASEAEVKAAYLYRFATYVEWPAKAFTSPEEPFMIGVIGADDVEAQLAVIVRGRRMGTHPIAVRAMHEGDDVKGVQLLFVAAGQSDRLPAIVQAARAAGALVVTESPGALEQGSEINFVPIGDRIGFEVSLASAQRSGHRISSRMLALARRVVQRPL